MQEGHSYSALQIAVATNQLEAVKLLLKHGADVDFMVRSGLLVQCTLIVMDMAHLEHSSALYVAVIGAEVTYAVGFGESLHSSMLYRHNTSSKSHA